MPEKKTILVIDDDKGVRELLREFLKLYGFEAHSIDSGISALNLLKKKYFDIIITDYSMPEINGIELTRAVKARYPHVLIIGMSGNSDGEEFLEAGADAFLSKPLQLQELLSVCQSKV
jgi:CheY-like chemotaxis protein